jgi:hypothetical protein
MRMKPWSFLILAWCAPVVALPAPWDKVPHVRMPVDAEWDFDFVKKNMAELHPWKAGMPLPKNFKEAGLKPPVRLVDCKIYFDGGSNVYLFRGANGKFLVLCNEPPEYEYVNVNHEKLKFLVRDFTTLHLGAWHCADKEGTVIPPDSETERFLLAAIESEAARIGTLVKAETAH